MDNNNKPKDPMILVRSVSQGFNSKKDTLNPEGGKRIQLSIGGDANRGNTAITDLIDVLMAHKDAPRGVKLDIHISKKEANGRQFESCIFFVRPIQEGGFGGNAGPRKFVPKNESLADLEAKVAKLKAQQIA